jgi:cytoskeletal protein CcmA (bactofilin family)
MNCFSELKYSMYVDRELPADEARLVEAHLFVCPRCRALVEALRVEGRTLQEVLSSEEERSESSRIGRSLLWTVLSAVALVLILDQAANWLQELIPSAADWLNPFHPSTLLNLVFSFTMSLANASGGVTMLNSIVTTVGAFILGLSSLIGLYLLVKRRSSLSAVLLVGLALILLPSAGSAIEIRHEGRVTVSRNETIDGTLIAAGDTVNIDGTVNGDLVVSGRSVNVRGRVKGDVLCLAKALDFGGNAEGNLYGLTQSFDLRGTVERNIYTLVHEALLIDNSGRVGGDVIAGTTNGRFEGAVGRDVLLFAGDAHVEGGVGRDFQAYVGDITLSPPGGVGGNLVLFVRDKDHVHLDPGVTIAGKTDIQIRKAEPSRYATPKFYFWEAVKLVAALITGLLIAWLFPALFRTSLDRPGALTALAGLHAGPEGRALLKAAGVGFLVLVATPVAVVILAFTLVGLPIAILTLFTWLAGLYLAKVFVGALVGQGILKSQAGGPPSLALSLLLGLFIVFVAIDAPYVGGWLNFLVILLGLGIAVTQTIIHRPRSTPSHGSPMALADPSR